MKEPLKGTCIWGALLLILVLMATGCSSPSQAQEPTATPSPPTTTPAVAKLDVRNIVVEHQKEGIPSRNLKQHERVDVHENDLIKVLNEGRARLDFQGIYVVDLFRGAEVELERIRVDPDGYVFTILRHMGDHIRVEQNQNTNGQLMVVTDHATITPSDGSEVIVCQAEPVTCIAAVKGRVEVEAQGEVTTLEDNESTFVLKGQPPKPAICSDRAELRQWLDKKLGTREVEDLVHLVERWSQEPCPGSATPTPTVTPPDPVVLECNVIAGKLNLRDAPSTSRGRRIGLLRYGDHFEAAARNADGTWEQVARPQTGWVSASTHYVSCDGSIADLPVSE